jgi:hypothetical protein
MGDYPVKAWKVQKRGATGFFIVLVLVLEDLEWSHGWDRRLPRPRDYGALYGTDVTDGLQKSHRVSGRYAVPGVLMLFKSSSTSTSTRTRTRTSTIEEVL